jgi:GntR family transcriptional regulator
MKKKKTGFPDFDIDLSKNTSTPLYMLLVKHFNELINNKALKEGDLIPAELYLCEKLNLSRSTVRKALAELEQTGIVVRKQGKGTFVARPKLRRSLRNLYNFSQEMNELGIVPTSEVLSFKTIKPAFFIATQLNLPEDDDVYEIIRLRKGNGRPLLLETALIPVKFCPRLRREDLNDSLYALIADSTGYQVKRATEIYEAVLLKKREAGYFQCRAGTPAFKITRTSLNVMDEIFECTTIIAPGDCNRYEITLERKETSYTRVH